MSEQRKSYFKEIPPDAELEKFKKGSMVYKRKQNTLRCCLCEKTATCMLIHQLEGCKKVEKYCNGCALKAKQNMT